MFRLINSLKGIFGLRMGLYKKRNRHTSLCEGSLERSSHWHELFATANLMFWCIKQQLVGLMGPQAEKWWWATLSHSTFCCTASRRSRALASLTYHYLRNDCRLTTACQGHVHLHHSCMRTLTATLRVVPLPLLNKTRLVFPAKLCWMLYRCMFPHINPDSCYFIKQVGPALKVMKGW